MRKTIAQTRIDDMAAQGWKLAGRTSGNRSFRKGSNLMKEIARLGLNADEVVVCCGARAGQRKTEGYELLIFVKDEATK